MLLKAYFFLLKHKVFRHTLILSLAGCANSIGYRQSPKDISAQPATIQAIIYKSYGGEMGYSMSFHVTKDSLCFYTHLAANNKTKQRDTINTIQFWDSLVVNFDLTHFKQIKNGYSNQPVDGADEEIAIVTNALDTITVINAYQDTTYFKYIEKFTELLRRKSQTF
jgi:hypothetical protein